MDVAAASIMTGVVKLLHVDLEVSQTRYTIQVSDQIVIRDTDC